MDSSFLRTYMPYMLQQADQLLSTRFHEELAKRGIQTSEWRVLAVVLDVGPVSIGELTTRSLLPQPTTTHTVSRLEREGLVQRRVADGDRRQRVVELTPAGRRLARLLTRRAAADLDATCDAAELIISPDFVAELQRILSVLQQ